MWVRRSRHFRRPTQHGLPGAQRDAGRHRLLLLPLRTLTVGSPITNVVGFDDAPFAHHHRGRVRIVGAVCARTRLDGVVSGFVSRDGANSTSRIIQLIRDSQFVRYVRAVLLQGIALAGFNVVDVVRLHETLEVPVLVVVRRPPRLTLVKSALFGHTPGAARKWKLIEQAGEVERVGPICVQRVGIDRDAAVALLRATTLHGNIPEPLRLAHLIAGGITLGTSHGRV
jgi:endonuclease V-like protein UPF0215 family